jgi:paraquat-inducible protein A
MLLAQAAVSATKECPACRGSFALPQDVRGPLLCPHCKALVQDAPAARRSNQNAATLAILSEAVLAVAVFLPFMSVVKLGETETYSLVGGIRQLWEHGEVGLAVIIGMFSLVFPLVKNALLVAATTTLLPLTHAHRRSLHAFAAKTGKYSMLDVFVVAIIVVVVKLGKSTEVAARSGVFLFCVAIALSMAASAFVRIGESHEH